MNRNLLTQIKNEGRDNLWLVVEFTIVAVVVWMLTVSLRQMLENKYTELGYDIEDVYRISVRRIAEDNPRYIHDIDNNEDLRTLIANIRKSPYVETAGFSRNSMPYSYSYLGYGLKVIGEPDSILYAGNTRQGSPQMARVLRLKGVDGITPEELEEMLAKGSILISPITSKSFTTENREWVESLIGKRGFIDDTTRTYPFSAFIYHMRRNDFESGGNTIYVPIDESTAEIGQAREIGVRVKPGMGKKFEDEFYANPDMRMMRNTYLSQLKDMRDVRAVTISSQESSLRLYVAGIVFLLVIIFLGLLGTFWFRIRQRTGEIALRKTCGATARDIFRRIIGEGMILLAVALIPALIIGTCVIYFYYNELELAFFKIDWSPFALCFGITAAVMALIIIIGVLIPARRAMSIEPAIALKEE